MAQSHKLAHHPRGRAVPQQRSRLPLIMMALALVTLILGAIIVSLLAQPAPPVTTFTPRPLNAPTGTTAEGYAYKGSPDAPVTVIEYGDFQCPSCAAFATEHEAAFDQQYVETGKVRLIYHDLPLAQHEHAVIVAAAARAAGEQGKYWQMHDLLFSKQRAWSSSRNIQPLLLSYADAIGLDRQAFEQVLESGKYTEALQTSAQLAAQRGVQATPTFEVDGQLVSAAELDAAILAALEAKAQ